MSVLKRCWKCEKELPLADFGKDRSRPDGLDTRCKQCAKEWNSLRNQSTKRQKSKKVWYQNNREGQLAAYKKWHQDNRPRWRAKRKVGEALRMGKLKKQPCELCGNPISDAHHMDYSKPLDVTWLCRLHHKQWHVHNQPIGG